jgi:soluble lytic murein transglycosylase-like protein
VVSRRVSFALGCALFAAACATQPAVRPAPAREDGALYDSAAEWANANRRADAPMRTRALLRRPHRRFELAPVDELRALTSTVLARSRGLQPIVFSASRAHSVPSDLVNGIIWAESRFQIHATSPKGACGLMQLMPRTGREVARAIGLSYHPYDPAFNIHAGTYYFSRMVDRFDGDVTIALAAYNIGPGRVDTWLRARQPLPGHSRAYVGNVFAAARAFRLRAY